MWQFLDPSMLWWLAAALPAIAILYFLRLRREQKVVSSTLLWKRSVYDLRVNAPIQMIRRNLLLVLQLLAIAGLIGALARPFTKLQKAQGRRAALIIDVSASMGTRDETDGKTRLAAAKEEALKIIGDLGVAGEGASAEDQLCIIAAADSPVTLCGLTSDKNRLRAAVESIAGPRETGTDLAKALQMAVAMTYVQPDDQVLQNAEEIRPAERPPDGQEEHIGLSGRRASRANVIILSDGRFDEIPASLGDRIAGPSEDGVGLGSRYIPFGRVKTDNMAIVALDLRIASSVDQQKQAFVRLENFADEAREATVEVTLNGEFLDRKRGIGVPARSAADQNGGQLLAGPGQAGVLFDLPADARGVLQARLTKPGDALPADDVVQAVLEPPTPIRVLIVTASDAEFQGSYFLETALAVDRDHVIYDTMAPAAWPESGSPRNADGQSYEIVIFDRWAPAETPPGASFFVDCVPNLPGLRSLDPPRLYDPLVVDWRRAHPLMLNLTLLDRLRMLKCRHLAFEGGWTVVMDGQGLILDRPEDAADLEARRNAREVAAPLLGCLITEQRRVAVLGFDIWETERWPWRVSFPLFIRNTVHWLARPGGVQQALALRTGETLRTEYPEEIENASVTAPDGSKHQLVTSGARQVYFSQTHRTGLYTVHAPGQPDRVFAFNLLSSRESDNGALPEIALGDQTLAGKRQPAEANVDLWPYVVLFVLGLLMLEWYIYNRRILG